MSKLPAIPHHCNNSDDDLQVVLVNRGVSTVEQSNQTFFIDSLLHGTSSSKELLLSGREENVAGQFMRHGGTCASGCVIKGR